MSRISVIVPVYNGDKTLGACLESIRRQLTSEDELIVVDDASTDQTGSVVANFPAIYTRNQQNQGPAISRNIGAGKASGDYLVFIDSDVVLKDDELEVVKNYFELHANVDAVTGSLDPDLVSHNFYTDYKNLYMNYIFSKCDRNINFIYGSFCAIRKEKFESWPQDPRLGEDSHWGYQLTQNGKRIHLISEIKVIHLKEYNFSSLAKNDFQIAKNFTLLFLRHQRWQTIYTQEKFGHTTKNQKISLILAALATLLLFLTPSAAIIMAFIWLILNLEFLVKLEDARDFSFFLKSLCWTFFDHLIYTAGIIHGCLAYWSSR